MRTLSHQRAALLVLAGFSVLMGGSLGCSGSPGGTEEALGEQSNALATHGALDTTFHGTGEVASYSQGGEGYKDVKIQPDGKLVAAGYIMHNAQSTPPQGMNIKVARVLPTGAPDPTFGKNGVASLTIDDESIAYSSAILPNGNILVVGQATHYGSATGPSWSKAFILQLTSNGALDTAFGTGGVIQLNIGCFVQGGTLYCRDEAYDVAVQPDGKFLIAGDTYANAGPSKYSSTNYPFIARLLPTGAFDTSFGKGGIAKGTGLVYDINTNSDNTFHRIRLQSNGSIIGVGHATTATSATYSALIERFTSAGVVDTTFGTGGRIIDNYLNIQAEYMGAALLSNGNIVAAGYSAENCQFCQETVVAQYNSAGKPVSTFGSGGKATYLTGGSGGDSVAIQTNGQILVSGSQGTPGGQAGGYVMRLNPTTGSADTTFWGTGTRPLPGPVYSLALQSDGKIVGGGLLVVQAFPAPIVDSALYRLIP
jgi:uncharacterized delta-60 repeat protein